MSDMKKWLKLFESENPLGEAGAGRPKMPKITYRQEGGDDGYSYVVRMDGREVYNGLNRSQAMHYKEQLLRDWKAKNKLSESPVDEPVNQVEEALEDESVVYELEEAVDEAKDLVRKLSRVIRRLPAQERAAAEAYWLPHLKCAIDSNEYGYGGHETDMAGTLRSLKQEGRH